MNADFNATNSDFRVHQLYSLELLQMGITSVLETVNRKSLLSNLGELEML
jgi:hypothetical protein